MFFINPAQIINNRILIKGKDFHHLHNVLRLKKGDYLQLADGEEILYLARIEHISLREAQVLIVEILGKKKIGNLNIIVGQAVPKGQKMDFIVEKGTELGVSAFVPLLTEHIIPKTGTAPLVRKLQRWERIAQEASKQCRRLTIPKIYSPMDLSEFCRSFHKVPCKIILWEKASQGLKKSGFINNSSQETAILVGPEGGFSPQEVDLAQEFGFAPILLGERTLRTETASLVILSILQFLWGDLG